MKRHVVIPVAALLLGLATTAAVVAVAAMVGVHYPGPRIQPHVVQPHMVLFSDRRESGEQLEVEFRMLEPFHAHLMHSRWRAFKRHRGPHPPPDPDAFKECIATFSSRYDELHRQYFIRLYFRKGMEWAVGDGAKEVTVTVLLNKPPPTFARWEPVGAGPTSMVGDGGELRLLLLSEMSDKTGDEWMRPPFGGYLAEGLSVCLGTKGVPPKEPPGERQE
jgi:hypothetical protein